MKHIKRHVYIRNRWGLTLMKKGVFIEVDKNEPFVGTCVIGGRDYVVEVDRSKWIVNADYSRRMRKK